MTIKEAGELEALRRIGAVVAEARDTMGRAVAPGISTLELDAIGRQVLERHGARSAPQLAYDFPAATCISVNDELAHGIPSAKKILREGDLVNIDVSAELDGLWADTGASFAVGRVSARDQKLLWTSKQALHDAMGLARAGNALRDIGRAVERRAKKAGLQVVRNLCGHGVGRFIHEPPSVPNTAAECDRTRLWEGLVITIEPFVTTGARSYEEDDDGWTLRTPDGSRGAQFEHTMVITKGAPIVLTC
jgi:methionyl aminopeptidase